MPTKLTMQSAGDLEAARKRGHETALAEMAEFGEGLVALSVAEIDARIRGVRQIFASRHWHEFSHRAVHVQSSALAPLRKALEDVQRNNAAAMGQSPLLEGRR